MRHTFTYLIHAPLADRLKIGQSNAPRRRFADLAAASPVPLVLLAILDPKQHPQYEEKLLHSRFFMLHDHNEWFKLEGDLKAWLELVLAQEQQEPLASCTIIGESRVLNKRGQFVTGYIKPTYVMAR